MPFSRVFAAVLLSCGAATAASPPWETFPTGRAFTSEVARPTALSERVCSLSQPVCVHGRAGSAASAFATLTVAEEAMRALTLQAGLPPPRPDGDLGGSPALDLYLGRPDGDRMRVGLELPTSSPVDRTSAFAVIDERATGCALRIAVFRAVASAQIASIDAGAEAGEFASISSYLAAVLGGCPRELDDAVDRAQRAPEASIFHADTVDAFAPSPILPLYLEGGFASGAVGALLTALVYGGEQSTPAGTTRYRNRIDMFEVLRRVAKARDKRVDEALLDLAVARAFMGDRDDGRHVRETASFGAFGRVRFDGVWSVSTLPRRAAFTPLMPTGSTYFWIDLAGAKKGVRVALHIEWEQPSTFRWAAVRIGRDGEEISRVEITTPQAVETVEREISVLDDVAALLLVGVNVGEVGPGHPFRVDEAPYEPHGGTVFAFLPD